MLRKHSISFIILMLLLGFLLGAVMGSLIETIFGLSFLNRNILPNGGWEIKDFYVIRKLNLQITPASILGVIISIYFLYKQTTKL